MSVQGYCAPHLQALQDSFAAQLAQPNNRGAAFCVQRNGETLVDLWGGFADRHASQPWQADTLVNVFSCSKPFAAVAALALVEQGKLELDAPLARYWPEFAQAGKHGISLRQVLSHQAGLPALRELLPAEALFDWSQMCAVLAAESPWWTPGEQHGYAPITYGWLVGELLRRVTAETVGDALLNRTSRPLGLDFHMGLDEQTQQRVSDVSRLKNEWGDEAAQRLVQCFFTQPTAMTTRAFTNPPSILTSTNTPQWRAMAQPAANGHGNARSLAGFFSALLDGRLLGHELLAEMTREHAVGVDQTLLTRTRFGLGCMLDQPDVANATFGLGPRTFGHPGAGGSLVCADPDSGVVVAYVTNSLGPYVLMDPRVQQLNRQLVRLLD